MICASDYLAQCQAEFESAYQAELAEIKKRGSVFPDAPGGNSSRLFPDGCYSVCPHVDVAEAS